MHPVSNRLSVGLVNLMLFAPLMALAQQAYDFNGVWNVTFPVAGGGQRAAVLTLSDSAATWRDQARNPTQQRNPCYSTEHQVTVKKRSADELAFTVNATAYMASCIDINMRVKPVDADTLEGALPDGRVIKMTRAK